MLKLPSAARAGAALSICPGEARGGLGFGWMETPTPPNGKKRVARDAPNDPRLLFQECIDAERASMS